MSEPMLWWGIGLFVLGFVLILLEALVPSAGIISVLSGTCVIASIVCFWRVSPMWGLTSMVSALVLAPIAIGFMMRVYPDTYFGRRMILGDPEREAERRVVEREEQAVARRALVGLEGRAATELRPVGVIVLDGERLEALSEHGVISAGAAVRITAVEGDRIRVRAIG